MATLVCLSTLYFYFFTFCTTEFNGYYMWAVDLLASPRANVISTPSVLCVFHRHFIYQVCSCMSDSESESQSGSRLAGEHVNQSCQTTCIPVTSWHHPRGFGSSGHPSHSLYLGYSSLVFQLCRLVFTPLMSPPLNACFSTTPEYPQHRSEGCEEIRS